MENTMTTETKTTAAQDIRAALKAAFPGVKFSVRKDSHSAVRVIWTDGPAEEAVEKVASQWEAGHFNGMTDSYDYAKDRKPNAVRFVFCSREISPELAANVRADLIAMYSAEDYLIDRTYHQMTRTADLRKAYKGIQIVNGAFAIVTE